LTDLPVVGLVRGRGWSGSQPTHESDVGGKTKGGETKVNWGKEKVLSIGILSGKVRTRRRVGTPFLSPTRRGTPGGAKEKSEIMGKRESVEKVPVKLVRHLHAEYSNATVFLGGIRTVLIAIPKRR